MLGCRRDASMPEPVAVYRRFRARDKFRKADLRGSWIEPNFDRC